MGVYVVMTNDQGQINAIFRFHELKYGEYAKP